MTSTGMDVDADADAIAADAALVAAARRRMRRMLVADRGSGLLAGGSFLVAAAAWILLAPPGPVPIGTFVGCVAAYVVAGCVEFEIGPGCALPTTPVQFVMLFLLPAQLVPLAVVLGLVGSARVARIWDPTRQERTIVLAASGWQVVGPAAVFAVAHVHQPAVSDWPVYVLAVVAQFSLDGTISWVRNCYGLGVPTKKLAMALRFTFACDLCLAPVGITAALALPNSPGAMVVLLPPIVLLAVLQSDRRKQIDKTVALSAAFADTSDLARRDVLTGVSNRLAFEEAAERYKRSESAVGVVLADVDGLKTANDTHGHAMGDRLLIAVAERIVRGASAATSAPVFRIGGDEFAILLPFATHDATQAVAASLRAAIDTASTLDEGVPISASVGFGLAPSGPMIGQAIAHADRAVNNEKTRRGVRR